VEGYYCDATSFIKERHRISYCGLYNVKLAIDLYSYRLKASLRRVMSTLTDPATGETFALETAKGFSYPLSKEDTRRVQVRMTLPNRTEELRDGEEAGVVKFYLKGHRIGKVKLVCAAQSSGSDAA
jgi:hypothetical protein